MENITNFCNFPSCEFLCCLFVTYWVTGMLNSFFFQIQTSFVKFEFYLNFV